MREWQESYFDFYFRVLNLTWFIHLMIASLFLYKPHLGFQRKHAASITSHCNTYFSKLLCFLKTNGNVASQKTRRNKELTL